jgi:hypothetical protein
MKPNPRNAKQKIMAAIVMLAVVFMYFYQNDNASSMASVAEKKPKMSELWRSKSKTLIAKAAMALNANHDTCKINVKKIDCNQRQLAAPDIKNVWLVGSVKAAQPSIRLNDRVVAYEVIEINQHPDQIPQIGEQVLVPMLKGKSVTVNVQSVSTSPNGDKTWRGHVQGEGTDYPVIMTYGEHTVFAMITTPEGSYSMESVDGVGWLYKNPSEFELAAPNSKDYLEVVDIH